MGIFKKVDPLAWVDFVKQAQSHRMSAANLLRGWIDVTDYKLSEGSLLESYTSRLPEGYSPQGDISDFDSHLTEAETVLQNGFKTYGAPRLRGSRFDKYAIAVVNQEVFQLTLQNIFQDELLKVGAWIHCKQKGIDTEQFEPYGLSVEHLRIHQAGLEIEKGQYLDLFFGNDIVLGKRDTSDAQIQRWAENSFRLIAPYQNSLSEKKSRTSSLMPWIFGKATSPDLSTFGF
ncbi:hypothetical protein MCEMRE217_00238 [Candidatus Nanopelagicaceae bacterium]